MISNILLISCVTQQIHSTEKKIQLAWFISSVNFGFHRSMKEMRFMCCYGVTSQRKKKMCTKKTEYIKFLFSYESTEWQAIEFFLFVIGKTARKKAPYARKKIPIFLIEMRTRTEFFFFFNSYLQYFDHEYFLIFTCHLCRPFQWLIEWVYVENVNAKITSHHTQHTYTLLQATTHTKLSKCCVMSIRWIGTKKQTVCASKKRISLQLL